MKARVETLDDGTRVVFDANGNERMSFGDGIEQARIDAALATYSLTDAEWLAEIYRLNPLLWLCMGGSKAQPPFPIRHPILHYPHGSRNESPAELVKHFEYKLTLEKEYLAARDWSRYLFLTEKPYRALALFEIEKKMTHQEYWESLAWVYTNSENTYQNKPIWKSLFRNRRSEKQFFMTEAERTTFDALPETFKVYRGYNPHFSHGGLTLICNKKGRSWSLSYDVALNFTHRYGLGGGPEFVREKTVSKADGIVGYLDCREEQEIVFADPK